MPTKNPPQSRTPYPNAERTITDYAGNRSGTRYEVGRMEADNAYGRKGDTYHYHTSYPIDSPNHRLRDLSKEHAKAIGKGYMKVTK